MCSGLRVGIALVLFAVVAVAASCSPSTSSSIQTDTASTTIAPTETWSVSGITTGTVSTSTNTIPAATLSVEELKNELDTGRSLVLVDVRAKADYDVGHIAGALSMPSEEIADRYGEVAAGSDVVVYADCA